MAITPSQIGAINGDTGTYGKDTALFLKKWSGEIQGAFPRYTVAMPRTRVHTITKGKSYQFPATGRAVASYLAIGGQIATQTINVAERVIAVDQTLQASVALNDWEEMVSHYDVRTEFTNQLAEALGQTIDQHILQVGVLAARASATVTGLPGGTEAKYGASGLDTADELETALLNAAKTLDINYVPPSERFAYFRPNEWYLLLQADGLTNRDNTPDAPNSYATKTLRSAFGIDIVQTQNLPSTDLSGASTTGQNNTYVGNFSTTAGLVLHRTAVGTVKLHDLTFKASDRHAVGYLDTLITAHLALGHGILRPECAVELSTATP